MGSYLQHLNHTRWEVTCTIQPKMKFLVVLLSATLVYGAADPELIQGHISHHYNSGPHCHDKKEQQCHKKPKQEENEECYVEYDIVVDVHYEKYGHEDYHKRSAQPGEHGYSSGHNCKDKKQKECHKHPDAETRKVPRTICKKVVDTIYIEECEEIIKTDCESSHDQYHHSQHYAGHDSKKIAHSDHSHYGSYGSHH